jgi:hypothetical protein
MKAMWTIYIYRTKTSSITSLKASRIKADKSKNYPPRSAVGFTHSGGGALLARKNTSKLKDTKK